MNQKEKRLRGTKAVFACMLIWSSLLWQPAAYAQQSDVQPRMKLDYFRDSLFLKVIKQELAYSVAEMGPANGQIPKYLLGTPVSGDFALAGIAETFAALYKADKTESLAGNQLIDYQKAWFMAEAPNASTFSQLFLARTLLAYETGSKPLANNKLWAKFSKQEQAQVISALDFRRSYDVKTKSPAGGRPQNYLAVALLIGAHATELGINPDQTALTELAKQCAAIVKSGGGLLDDDKSGRGRYDRYGREFVQFVWESLKILKMDTELERIKPEVKFNAQLWFDMLNPETGYSYPFGRSLQNSWDDTFEQCALLAENPELSPTSLPVLATVYAKAWQHYLSNQYNFKTHLNRMLEPGRGTYSYAGPNRIWSYTTHTFGKALLSGKQLFDVLAKSGISSWTQKPELPGVERWVPISHKGSNRKMGFMIVRNPTNYLVIPVVGSFKGGAANTDYLPVPYGFKGVQQPVQQQTPTLVPHFTLSDGTVLTTAEGADSVSYNDANHSLTFWTKSLTDLKGNYISGQLEVKTVWQWQDHELINQVEVSSQTNRIVRQIDYWVPTTYENADLTSGAVYNKQGEILNINGQADWDTRMVVSSALLTSHGKGAYEPIPLIVKFTGLDVPMTDKKTYQMKVTLRHSGF